MEPMLHLILQTLTRHEALLVDSAAKQRGMPTAEAGAEKDLAVVVASQKEDAPSEDIARRIAADKAAEAERVAKAKADAEKEELARRTAEAAAEKAAAERAAEEKATREKMEADKAKAEKAAREREEEEARAIQAAAERAAEEKAAREKMEADKAEAERAAREREEEAQAVKAKTEASSTAAEKAAAEIVKHMLSREKDNKVAGHKAEAERISAPQPVPEKEAAEAKATTAKALDASSPEKRSPQKTSVALDASSPEKSSAAKSSPRKPEQPIGKIMENGPAGKFKVVGEKAVVRQRPTTTSPALAVTRKGETMSGVPHDVDGKPWLKLDPDQCKAMNLPAANKEAWMLMDGSSLNQSLGILLERMEVVAPLRMTAEAKRKLLESVTPAIPDMPREGLPLWVVTGGAGKGGILVRQEEELGSKPLPIKLATGTLIEEMESVGNRLHYRRIRGDGPDFGWVNITFNDRYIIDPVDDEE